MWKSHVKSRVRPSFFVMPHSWRVLTVFTRISTRVLRGPQSPTFELIESLIGVQIGLSFDSSLLVRGHISYWIQMWVGVYRLFLGLRSRKAKRGAPGGDFGVKYMKKISFDRIWRRLLSLPKVKGTVLTRLYNIAVLMWFTEKAAHGMILKMGHYETKDVKSTTPFRIAPRVDIKRPILDGHN
jgi:hypothetical protein